MYNQNQIKSSKISVNNHNSLSIKILTGEYERLNNNSFYIGEVKYLIRERKTKQVNKPKYFLSALKDKKHEYISSLYGSSNSILGKYQFDYVGKKYHMVISENKVKIFDGY